MQRLNAFHPDLKFTHEKSIHTSIYTFFRCYSQYQWWGVWSQTDCHQFLEFNSAILFITKNQLCIAKGCALKGCVPRKMHLKNGIGVSFVVTYHPRFHNLSNTIRKLFIYLYAEEQVKKVFIPAPFVSFRSGYSLRSHSVPTKVYLLIWEKGTSCCGKSRCKTSLNIQETDHFQSFVSKKFTKLIIIFIVIVNVLFTLFHVKYVACNILGQQLTDFV